MLTLGLLAAAAGAIAASAKRSVPAAPAGRTGFTVGLVSGSAPSWEAGLTSAANLHPKVVRVGFNIGTSVSQLRRAVATLAAKGEQALPVAEFYGRIPSTSQAQSLAGWAHAFGPGGSFWRGRSNGQLAVRYIEFGNETNDSYQFGGCGNGCSAYGARAQQYALRLKDAQQAIRGPQGNQGVGLLAQGDDHGPTWADNMYRAVPDLNRRIAGWTEHPYGPDYKTKMNTMLAGVARHGGGNKPIFVTEFGISTDNGRCLSDNYGWSKCLDYAHAANSLRNSIADLHASYPRLADLFIFAQRDMQPSGSTNDREGYFGALQSMGQRKGAFTSTVRSLLNSYRG